MKTNSNQGKARIEFDAYANRLLVKQNNFTNKKFIIKIANDLLFNEKSHLVSKFKDFLIYDDSSEFFKRFYKKKESTKKLDRILDYYERSSRVFPNYTVLYEAKYIYKNIQKKQKVIDEIQQMDDENKEKHNKGSRNQYKNSFKLDEIFDTEAFELINEPSNSDYIGLDLFDTQLNVIKSELIEDEEMNLIDKIVSNITNAEEKQLSSLRIQTEFNQKKKVKLANVKNILITQTFMLKKSFINHDKKENESINVNMNTSFKKVMPTHQSNQLSSTSLNHSKAHRILKSCVFSSHQKQISSQSSFRGQNSIVNSLNGSKLLRTQYIQTESSVSPKKKILLASDCNGIYNKYETSIKHYLYKMKIMPKSIKLKPQPTQRRSSRERIQIHLTTGSSSITRKLAIPLISNKAPNKGIYNKSREKNTFQNNQQVLTLPSSNENYPNNTLTSRNRFNVKTDRNDPKLQLSWKKIKRSPYK